MIAKELSFSEVSDIIDSIWDEYDEEHTGAIDFDRFKELLSDIFNATGHDLPDSVLEQIKDRFYTKSGRCVMKEDVVGLFSENLEVYE